MNEDEEENNREDKNGMLEAEKDEACKKPEKTMSTCFYEKDESNENENTNNRCSTLLDVKENDNEEEK